MKKFITLFEKTENIHLIKDVGQIPYLMHIYFGYDSTIVTYKNNNSYPYLNNEVKGLKLEFIPKIKFGRYSLSILWYLFLNSKKIDVLHMFHHREKTYLNFLMYKWRNPKGIAFLKSDIGLNSIKEYDGFIPVKRLKYAIRQWLFKKVIPKLDIITIETKEGYDYICNKYPEYANRMLFMSNSIDIERMHELVAPKKFQAKENIILTVGRIGAKEKNNEMLLSAIKTIDLKNWKVVFVGPIDESFKSIINNFYNNNPDLVEKVIFTGAIYDRKLLFEWYARSKIFCLTSIEESFGFVLIEAMSYGNYIITTPISSANEITQNQKFGRIVSDQNILSKTLEKNIENQIDIENCFHSTLEYAENKFGSNKILNILQQNIFTKM